MFSVLVSAFDEFVISDIRVVGLQRVSIGSIFTIIPISVGDRMSEEKVRDIVLALFDTEQFNDIKISQDGTALIIDIEERPSISSIELEGNSALKSEDLLRGLEGAGIAEGQVYKRSTLEGMKSELVRQYASQGRYGAGVEVETFDKPRNTIDLRIIIDEGKSAKIKSIKVIGNSIFVGDTLFMPDIGSARADFPGGDARQLYRSIQKILSYPDETVIFVCHDYPPTSRKVEWVTTVGEQKKKNIHVKTSIGEDEFVKVREARDKTLNMPKLIIPSIQVNMRAGNLPPAEDSGDVFIKVPINSMKNLV